MKKGLMIILLILVAVGLVFANDATNRTHTVKVTAHVGAVNEAFFSDDGINKVTEPIPFKADNATLSSDSDTKTIHVVAKSNDLEGFTLEIFGTALTHKSGDSFATENEKTTKSIPITVAVDDGDSETFTALATSTAGAPTGDGAEKITIENLAATSSSSTAGAAATDSSESTPETEDGTESGTTGTQAGMTKVVKDLVISLPEGFDPMDYVAGNYEAYLTLSYSAN